jgi:hypothetical protein
MTVGPRSAQILSEQNGGSGACSTAEELDLDGGGSGNPAAADKSVCAQVRLHDRDAGWAVEQLERAAAVGP